MDWPSQTLLHQHREAWLTIGEYQPTDCPLDFLKSWHSQPPYAHVFPVESATDGKLDTPSGSSLPCIERLLTYAKLDSPHSPSEEGRQVCSQPPHLAGPGLS